MATTDNIIAVPRVHPRPVLDWVQYVGKTDYYMVFVHVSNRYWQNTLDGLNMVGANEQYIQPIHPNEFQKWVEMTAVCHRYQVQKMGEVYIADEAHRDSYPFHIPGFHRIKQIEVGMIFPLEGFKRDDFLSETDKKDSFW